MSERLYLPRLDVLRCLTGKVRFQTRPIALTCLIEQRYGRTLRKMHLKVKIAASIAGARATVPGAGGDCFAGGDQTPA